MGTPVERQNLSIPFFVLSTLLLAVTAWVFYDEFEDRRPWRGYQFEFFKLQDEKLGQDLAWAKAQMDKPETKAKLAALKTKLENEEKRQADPRDRAEIAKLKAALDDANIKVDDADVKVRLEKSRLDGIYYEYREAEHDEPSKLASVQKELDEVRERIAHLVELQQNEVGARDKLQDEYDHRVNAVAELQKQIDLITTDVTDAQRKYDTAHALVGNPMAPDLTQWWIPEMSVNTVERCQNCHAAIDKCGYSQPHEVIEASVEESDPAKLAKRFCLNPDTINTYKSVAAGLCAPITPATTANLRAMTKVVDDLMAKLFASDIEGAKADVSTGAQPALASGATGLKGNHLDRFELEPPRVEGISAIVPVRVDFTGADGKSSSDHQEITLVKGDSGWVVVGIAGQLVSFSEPAPSDSVCVSGVEYEGIAQQARLYCDMKHTAVPRSWTKGEERCFKKDDLDKVKKAMVDSDPKKAGSFHLPLVAQTHPHNTDLIGAHPPDRFGCTTCHSGEGPQTKGVEHKKFDHGYDDVYWEDPLANLVSYVRSSDGKVLDHQKQFVEANCAKCHQQNFDLAYAPTLDKGRKLVAEIGCYGCHPIDMFSESRKPGPPLTTVQAKMTPGYISNWVQYPRGIRPRTRMPNFWPEALDPQTHQLRTGSEEASLRDDEVSAITAYLWESSKTKLETDPIVEKANASHGKELVQSVGCYGCHAIEQGDRPRPIPGSAARDFAPNLWDIGDKANATWIYKWVKNPSAYWPQTRMPNLRLTDSDAADIAAFLATKKSGHTYSAPSIFDTSLGKSDNWGDQKGMGQRVFEEKVVEGKSLIAKYGCFGCHDVNGFENAQRIGAELNGFGRKATSLLDFGDAVTDPVQFTWYNWVDRKLRAPRSYRYERVDTKMPQFDFNDDEVKSIMVFLKSMQGGGEAVPHSYIAAQDSHRQAVEKGLKMVDFYNCRGCHMIDGKGGEIRDRYEEDAYSFAPPLLFQEGAKVQPDWVFNFIRKPIPLRPWLQVRMPTFPLDDDRTTDIVHYFAAAADQSWPYLYVSDKGPAKDRLTQAKAMVNQLQCFNCHTRGEPPPDADKSQLAPNLELARTRLRPEWVVRWLTDPQKLMDGTRMPQFWPPDDNGKPTSPIPDAFNGDAMEQMKAIRDYLFYGDLSAPPPELPKGKQTAMR